MPVRITNSTNSTKSDQNESTAEDAKTNASQKDLDWLADWPKNLNSANVERLPFAEPGKQVFYRNWNVKLQGFGVRVTASSKSYILEYWSAEKRKSIRVTLGKHGSKDIPHPDQALKKARLLTGIAASGADINEEKRKARMDQTTLRQVWEKYKDVKKLRPKTEQVYESALRRGLGDWLDKPIAKLTRAELIARNQELGKAVGPRSNPNGATENANQIMRTLRSLMIFAKEEYLTEDKQELKLPPDFATSFPKAYPKNRRHTRVEDGDLAAWYQEIMKWPSASARDMLLLCLFTGLRRSEASQLRWDQVNFTDKFLQLQAADTKTKEPHRVYLSDFTFDLLSTRNQFKDKSNPYVFPGVKKGAPISSPDNVIKRVLENTGIRFKTHDLRRTYVSVSANLDIPDSVSAHLLNHKRGSSMTQSYINVNPDRIRKYQQQITDRLKVLIGLSAEQEASHE